MAKSNRAVALMAIVMIVGSTTLAADELSYGEMVRTKLASGLTNMSFGIAEIPKNMINTSNEVNVMLGVTGGLMKGTLHSMGRLLAGGLDFLTFPVPSQPITHPAYVWQQFKTDTTYGPFFDMSRKPYPSSPVARPSSMPVATPQAESYPR